MVFKPMKPTPWWAAGADEFVRGLLSPTDCVFEWGAGGSSLWLRDQVKYLTSIEHNVRWHRDVKRLGVNVLLVDVKTPAYQNAIGRAAAIRAIDFVFIDGRKRVLCAREAIPRLKSGGYLLLDDSQRERYAPAIALLEGWERWDFKDTRTTSIFRKPLPAEAPEGDDVTPAQEQN